MTMRGTRVAPNAANAARGRRVDARRGRAGTRDGARGTTTTTTAATAAAAGRARTTTRRAIGPSEPTSFVEDEPRDEEIEAVVNEGRGNAGTGAQDVGRAARYMRELIKNQVNSNHLARAGSITDSSVLRRKGRLKEQDALIEFIVELHKTHTTEEVFTKVETWIDEVLEVVGLADRGDDRVDEYSGGMKRRLNIAVGLLHRPRLLLLDEPTVGVDPQSRNAILESVAELAGSGMSVLYTENLI